MKGGVILRGRIRGNPGSLAANHDSRIAAVTHRQISLPDDSAKDEPQLRQLPKRVAAVEDLPAVS